MKNFASDDSAWADFLISKAALILASIILFTGLFHLVNGFKEVQVQEQLETLANDFKAEVERKGVENFQEGFGEDFPESTYCFSEKELYQTLPPGTDVKIRISGEYVCLEAEVEGKFFRAVRPFTFKVLPFKGTVVHDRLSTRFGMDGSKEGPIIFPFSDLEAFLQELGTQEIILNPEENITLKKEPIYMRDHQGVSAFDCVLVY